MRIRFVCFAITVCAPFLKAQTPVIRAEAREVLVDVTVAGKNGASPGDLTAKDFSVWEDGKQQKITSVSTAGADPETTQKHFVIYFDFSMMRVVDQVSSQKFAASFIEGLASPDRFMAVATLGSAGPRILQDFTNAKAPLIRAAAAPLNTKPAIEVGFGNPSAVSSLVASLTTVCDSIAPAAGRKALLLFTGAGSNTASFQALTDTCNRANVALYVIAARNLVSAGSDVNRPQVNTSITRNLDPEPAATFAQTLAENTGGQAFGLTETLPGQLAAVAREQDDYYRVGYTPPTAKEGSCHTLRVAAIPRGVSTRARSEYCTEKPVDLVAGRIAGQGLESRAAAAGAGNLSASMELPYFYTGTNRVSVHLAVDVVPAGMKFDKDKIGLHGQLDLVGTASRSDGGTGARFADTVRIDMPDQSHAEAFTQKTYHYEHQFTMAAGTYSFQMAIGAGPNAVAKLEKPLTIEPWNSTTFGISGIAMSTEVRTQETDTQAGPVLEGHGPLLAGGRQLTPDATNRFARSEQVYFYTEVYDPTLASGNSNGNDPALTLQYRILDAKSGDVKLDSGVGSIANFVRAGNPVVPFATRLTVADLPSGAYRLEVRMANHGTNDAVTRSLDFELK